MAYCIYYQAENILSELKNFPIYLRRMEYTMLSLKSILMGAEEKQEHNHHLRNWLKELQNVFSQIEGSIDELKGEVYKTEGIGKQVLAPFSCSNQISHNRKMEELFDHLDAVASKMYVFNLTERHTAAIKMETTDSFLSATEVSTGLMKPSWKVLYPLTNAPKVYHHDRYNDFLYNFTDSTHGFFHIVGEAGIGKSTLAKFLYNDPKVVGMFPSRLWVCVKEEFDTQRLMKEIFSFSYCPTICDNLTERKLSSTVQQYPRDNTFLLVFQDLSIKNLDNCSMFKSLLGMGKRGSKIIVTTQNEEIADALRLQKVYKTEKQPQQNQSQIVPVPVTKETSSINNVDKSIQANPPGKLDEFITHQTIFKVERLSEEDSFSLFKDYASRDKDEAEDSDFNITAKERVKKCNGVPLAIKCLGSMVSLETSAIEEEDEDGSSHSILSTIRLCYDRMPSLLKPCFLYCSQLPNDSILSSNDVIQLWMANGLLHSPQENYLSLEDIGENYFKELCTRCFLQEFEEYGLGYWFKMHPLIRELANILIQEQTGGSTGIKAVTKVTSIAFPVRDEVPPSAFLAEKCISKFRSLRILYLGYTDLQEIPNAIGTLKHLRYLDLQGNKKIKRLPNSICNLQSLQTLILASCSALEELPNDIRKLIELRYLWVTANKLHLHKHRVGTMTSLRFLAIGGCDNLQDLFEQPSSLVRLETLMIYDCKTLKLLPNKMGSLISLQNLVIWSCKQLTLTLKKVEFSLRRFTVRELPKVDKLPEWLQRSTETLRVLEIIDCPIKVEEERFKMYKAVESKIIQGAVGVATNLVWRRPMVVKNVQEINSYY